MKTKQEVISPSNDNYFIDTHCHLDMAEYEEDLPQVLDRAENNGIRKIITIGINLQSSKRAIELARANRQISATIGIHPHDVDNTCASDYRKLADLYQDNSNRVVGYGEIGLDYVKQYSEPKAQRDHFIRQLELAHELHLPVIIHNREADEDCFTILSQAKPLSMGGIMHCFSGDYHYAKKIIDLGMLISIPGIVTFKTAKKLQEVATKIPLSALILETDGPFLAPHPLRGRRNEPANLLYTANTVAELRGITIDELAHQTTANAEKIFRLQ